MAHPPLCVYHNTFNGIYSQSVRILYITIHSITCALTHYFVTYVTETRQVGTMYVVSRNLFSVQHTHTYTIHTRVPTRDCGIQTCTGQRDREGLTLNDEKS